MPAALAFADPGQTHTICKQNKEGAMIYAIFMLLTLMALAANWFRHPLQLPLFIATVVLIAAHLALDMTTPLTLSF
jgi:hypothetical protein